MQSQRGGRTRRQPPMRKRNQTSQSPGFTPEGLPRSSRNWEAERRDRLDSFDNLSLISRSGGFFSERIPTNRDLRRREVQDALWAYILEEFNQEKFEHAVDLCRKLREGIVASNWSHQDYTFCIHVFQLSIKCSLKAGNYGELWKSLRGLVDELYVLQPPIDTYFQGLDVLYTACYNNDLLTARQKVMGLENEFAKKVTFSLWYGNPLEFFALYADSIDTYIRILMQHSFEMMRLTAVRTMIKVYRTVPVDWAARWLGTNHPSETIAQFRRLAPDSVGSVTNSTIRLVRGSRMGKC